jgi:hypothetical protein
MLTESQSTNFNHNLTRNTELDISNIQLVYQIDPTGEYFCYFTLEALGTNFTASGFAQCRFNISDPNVEEFILTISDDTVKVSETKINNCSLITFSIYDQIIPVGYPFTIRGSFYGKCTRNDSSIFQYTLGIDWGTVAGSQHTTIKIDNQKFTVLSVEPIPHLIEEIRLGIVELQWNEIFVGNFNINLALHRRQIQNTFLFVDRQAWNATTGQTVTIVIRNNGTFMTHGGVYTPNWISKNVSKFEISPNQSIRVTLTINSLASIGMNDSITILIQELWNPIIIPVKVVKSAPYKALDPSLLVISIFVGILTISAGYYNRRSIMEYISQRRPNEEELPLKSQYPSQDLPVHKNGIPEIVTPVWETVQARWKSILPDQEIQVVKILLSQGVLNQKTIAEQMGISEMKMSRIISRLETKRLLVREKLGMSNLIKLDKKKL